MLGIIIVIFMDVIHETHRQMKRSEMFLSKFSLKHFNMYM